MLSFECPEFDITCTATLRSELLKRTFDSFIKNLFGEYIEKANLIINIDKTGAKNKEKELGKMFKVIDSYPFNSIYLRIGETPHFPTAFLWCMKKLKSELFFHLEDDWDLVQARSFKDMVNIHMKYRNLAHLRLSGWISEIRKLKNWNKFLFWNGDFFEVPIEQRGTIGWCGHPSLNKTLFMMEILEHIDPKLNPEKQIKGTKFHLHPRNQIIMSWTYGCFQPQNSPKAIFDSGREWMVKNGFKKQGNKAWFTNWEEK